MFLGTESGRCLLAEWQRERETMTETETERDRGRGRETETVREREREREKERERARWGGGTDKVSQAHKQKGRKDRRVDGQTERKRLTKMEGK